MRKEAKVAIGLLVGAAAVAGAKEVGDQDIHLTQGVSPAEAMSLPGEGMFRRDEDGNAQQLRGGEWVGLDPIDSGENVFDNQADLLRLTPIQDSVAPETYRFSHFISPVAFNDIEGRWEVGGCYSTVGGMGCEALFEVPENKIDEINELIENQFSGNQ